MTREKIGRFVFLLSGWSSGDFLPAVLRLAGQGQVQQDWLPGASLPGWKTTGCLLTHGGFLVLLSLLL
jgi:hypothetical protein